MRPDFVVCAQFSTLLIHALVQVLYELQSHNAIIRGTSLGEEIIAILG